MPTLRLCDLVADQGRKIDTRRVQQREATALGAYEQSRSQQKERARFKSNACAQKEISCDELSLGTLGFPTYRDTCSKSMHLPWLTVAFLLRRGAGSLRDRQRAGDGLRGRRHYPCVRRAIFARSEFKCYRTHGTVTVIVPTGTVRPPAVACTLT